MRKPAQAVPLPVVPPSLAPPPAERPVHVWLFGGLGMLTPERPLVLLVPEGATIGQVVDALGRRLGSRLTERVMDTPERKFGICRLFLDGLHVDLDDTLPAGGAAPDLELIVLTASEGG